MTTSTPHPLHTCLPLSTEAVALGASDIRSGDHSPVSLSPPPSPPPLLDDRAEKALYLERSSSPLSNAGFLPKRSLTPDTRLARPSQVIPQGKLKGLEPLQANSIAEDKSDNECGYLPLSSPVSLGSDARLTECSLSQRSPLGVSGVLMYSESSRISSSNPLLARPGGAFTPKKVAVPGVSAFAQPNVAQGGDAIDGGMPKEPRSPSRGVSMSRSAALESSPSVDLPPRLLGGSAASTLHNYGAKREVSVLLKNMKADSSQPNRFLQRQSSTDFEGFDNIQDDADDAAEDVAVSVHDIPSGGPEASQPPIVKEVSPAIGDCLAPADSAHVPELELDLAPHEQDLFAELFYRLDPNLTGVVSVQGLRTALTIINAPMMTEADIRIALNSIGKALEGVGGAADASMCTLLMFHIFFGRVKLTQSPQAWAAVVSKCKGVVESYLDVAGHYDEPVGPSPQEIMEASVIGTSRWLSDTPLCWMVDGVVLVIAFYYGMMVPLQFLTHEALHTLTGAEYMFPLEVVFSLVLLLHFYIRLNTVVVGRNVINVDTGRHLRERVVTFSFHADYLGAIPFDLCLVMFAPKWGFFAAHSLRLLNLLKIGSLFRTSGLGIVTATHVDIKYRKMPVLKIALFSALFVHCVSCAFLLATCDDGTEYRCFKLPTLAEYQIAMYYTLYTITAVGYGDIPIKNHWSHMLSIILFITALLLNGWLIGKFTSYMMQLDVEGEHSLLMSRTLQVIRHFGLESDVVDDILSMQDHLLSQKVHLRSFSDVVERLPSCIQTVLHMYLRVEYLAQIPIFRSIPSDCLIMLSQSLLHNVFSRDEYMVLQGDPGECLIVLIHGFAHVIQDGERIASLMRGTFFGEMALLTNTSCCASVRCITYCESLLLRKEAFQNILREFPLLRYQLEVEMCKRRGDAPPPRPYAAVPDDPQTGAGHSEECSAPDSGINLSVMTSCLKQQVYNTPGASSLQAPGEGNAPDPCELGTPKDEMGFSMNHSRNSSVCLSDSSDILGASANTNLTSIGGLDRLLEGRLAKGKREKARRVHIQTEDGARRYSIPGSTRRESLVSGPDHMPLAPHRHDHDEEGHVEVRLLRELLQGQASLNRKISRLQKQLNMGSNKRAFRSGALAFSEEDDDAQAHLAMMRQSLAPSASRRRKHILGP